jgi:wobble nucleotide-excising tRNase
MFGEQLSLDGKIKEYEDKIILEEKKLKDISPYENSSSNTSPLFYILKMKKTLKDDMNWADFDCRIKGNKAKSSVNDTTLLDLKGHENNKNKKNLFDEFINKFEHFKKIRNNSSPINVSLDCIKNFNPNLSKINSLLLLQIEKPIGNQLTEKIVKTIENYGMNRLREIKSTFEKDNNICPYCFREINKQQVLEILDTIKEIQNDEVENHKTDLEQSKIEYNKINLEQFLSIDSNLVWNIKDEYNKLINLIEEINEKINEKLNDIFTPIIISFENVNNQIIVIKKLISQLEDKRIKYNLDIQEINNLKSSLLTLNKELFWHDIKHDYLIYEQLIIQKKEIIENNQKINEKIQSFKDEITNLKSQKANINIAMEDINNNLEYIFFSNERLRLTVDNNNYVIKVHGEDVELSKLSQGERNAISLCYMFTLINENLSNINKYKKSVLLILDDPISSFDFENKIGIFSFLRKMILELLQNNLHTKIIIFTHQIETMFDFEDLFKDINQVKYINKYILDEQQFDVFQPSRNFYGKMLHEIYEYAVGKSQKDLNIGNIMRRVLEAFATFNYKCSITNISNDKEIMELIKGEKKREYFSNSMYRLVMHNESHAENYVYTSQMGSLTEFISPTEKRRTAKDLLVFLYLLN